MNIEGGITGNGEDESEDGAGTSSEEREGDEGVGAPSGDSDDELVDKRTAGRRTRKFSTPRFGGPGGRGQTQRQRRKSGG